MISHHQAAPVLLCHCTDPFLSPLLLLFLSLFITVITRAVNHIIYGCSCIINSCLPYEVRTLINTVWHPILSYTLYAGVIKPHLYLVWCLNHVDITFFDKIGHVNWNPTEITGIESIYFTAVNHTWKHFNSTVTITVSRDLYNCNIQLWLTALVVTVCCIVTIIALSCTPSLSCICKWGMQTCGYSACQRVVYHLNLLLN